MTAIWVAAGAAAAVAQTLEQADLAVTQAQSPVFTRVGSQVSYLITVRNNGPDNATNVRISATLPAGAQLVSMPSFCTSPTAGRVDCTVSSVPRNSAGSGEIVVRLTQPGTVRNDVTVSFDGTDPDTTNNGSSIETFVAPAAGQSPPASAAAPPPALGRTVQLGRVNGRVLVRRRGSRSFRLLGKNRTVPVGSEIDATLGRVRLTSATDAAGATQTADFFSGRFVVQQRGVVGARTRLRLSERLSCDTARGAVASARRGKRRRRLWGDGKGAFETVGRRASAAITGTRWLTEDTCQGTRIHVVRGAVHVRDFPRRRTIRLGAGESYFAPVRR